MEQGVMKIEASPIYAPTLGIIGNIPPTMLDPRAFTNCNNVRLKDGVASKRTGYVAYGTGAITGVPLLLFRYQKFDLTEYEMLVTTTNVYYRSGAGAWTSIADTLSGTVDIRASLAYIQNYLVFTNGVDQPYKWDGTTWSALDDGKAIGWADYRPKILVPYKDRLIGFNDNLSGSPTGIRQIYSVLGDFDNVNDSGSGYNDFVQGEGAQIIGAAPLKDYIAVYKDYSCCLFDYIGGSSLYSFSPHIQGIGLGGKDAIANLGTSHVFLGSDWNIHEWNGGWELNHIGNPIKKLLQSELTAASKAKAKRNFAIINKEQREIIFFIVIGANDYPTRMWIYNIDDRSWSKGTVASISGGASVTKDGVERALLGLSAGTTFHYDYDALNDNGVAISAEFETGDFVLDKKQYMKRHRKYFGIGGDVKGSSASAKLTIQHSDDEGVTYTTISEKTLTAVYDWTKWDFLKSARKLRFKFKDATVGQRFYVRYYGLEQKEGAIG
jgi:hypothetical protein